MNECHRIHGDQLCEVGVISPFSLVHRIINSILKKRETTRIRRILAVYESQNRGGSPAGAGGLSWPSGHVTDPPTYR